MGIADLKLGTVILPRSESPKAISRLTEFEWYHKIDSSNDLVTPEIDDLLLKAQQTFQSIDDVVKGMGIPLDCRNYGNFIQRNCDQEKRL